MSHSFLGIDWGTGTIQVTYIDATGRPKIIQHQDGSTFLPAVVYWDDNDLPVFGPEADNLCLARPERGVRFAKRFIGKDDVLITVGGKGLTAEHIAELYLRYLKGYAERDRNRVFDSVLLTTPANWVDAQKAALLRAAKAAGFQQAEPRNEPTAALVARLSDDKRIANGIFVVSDGGCGTWDMTLVKRDGKTFTVLATMGINELGGKDFTQALVDHVAKQAAAQGVNISARNPEDYADLWRRCEDGKRRFNTAEQTTIPVVHDGKRAIVTIDRATAWQLWRPFGDQLIACLDQLMVEAAAKEPVTKADIKELFLIGGGSMCKFVEEHHEKWFGRQPSSHGDRINAVALGAAMLGLEHFREVETDGGVVIKASGILLKDVTAHAIGLSAIDAQGSPVFAIILEKGVAWGSTHTREFAIDEDGATQVVIEVLQGQPGDPLARCAMLGHFPLKGMPPVHGRPHMVRVTLHIDDNGMVTATARDTESQQVAELKLAYGRKQAA